MSRVLVLMEQMEEQNRATYEAVLAVEGRILARLDGRLERIELRLDVLEAAVRQNSADIGKLQAAVGQLQAAVDQNSADIEKLQAAVGQNSAEIAKLREELARINQAPRIEQSEDAIKDIERRVQEIERRLGITP
jgi:chromosome segregation ATPase